MSEVDRHSFYMYYLAQMSIALVCTKVSEMPFSIPTRPGGLQTLTDTSEQVIGKEFSIKLIGSFNHNEVHLNITVKVRQATARRVYITAAFNELFGIPNFGLYRVIQNEAGVNILEKFEQE